MATAVGQWCCMNPTIEAKLTAVHAICVRRRVRLLGLFGSATGASFDPTRSDVDVLVEFDQMDPPEHADCYFGLAEDLEALFGRPVDLVERSTIHNRYLRKAVDDTLVVVHDAA